MKRAAAIALALAAVLAAPAAAAERLELADSGKATFPNREFLLTLPEQRTLSDSDVQVTENGKPVRDLQVVPASNSDVILAIDASDSMEGKAIEQAMIAAQEFLRQRRPDQAIGVVFFAREATVALAPTTDVEQLQSVLSAPPVLSRGTRIFDATIASLEELEKTNTTAGAVVVLSDGDDVNSLAAADEVRKKAAEADSRVFTVGISSGRDFRSDALRDMTTPGATYKEAASVDDLEGIYADLGRRLANEYVVEYRSELPLESQVAVAVEVDGFKDVATAAYQTPAFPSPEEIARREGSVWSSTGMTIAVVAAIVMMLGFALWLIVRPARATVASRVEVYSKAGAKRRVSLPDFDVKSAYAKAGRWLERWAPWTSFQLDVELAKIKWPAARIAVWTIVLTLLTTALFGLIFDATLTALVILVVAPVVVRLGIKYKADKERRKFEEQLPDNLQVLASGLRAGHSFVGALTVMVNDAAEPSKKEYRRVLHDEQLGVSIEDSLNVVARRMKCEDVVYIGLVATIQRETGGNTAEVLDKVVETMRERGKIKRLVRTLTAQGRLGGWIVTALPIGMIVFLNLVRPEYMEPMTSRTAGWVILGFAAVMVGLGAYCIRRIVDIKV